MTFSVRLSDEESVLFKKYAEASGITVSELVRRSVLEKIEDEYDLAAFDRAWKQFEKNPKTYSLKEVEEELGLL